MNLARFARRLARRLARIEAQLPSGAGGLVRIKAGMRGLHEAVLEIQGERLPAAIEARGVGGGMRALRMAVEDEARRMIALGLMPPLALPNSAPQRVGKFADPEATPSKEESPCQAVKV